MQINKIISILLMFTVAGAIAQKNIYESHKFDELSKDHHVLAIIPFFTNLELKVPVAKEDQKKMEEKEGYAVQTALETYFSRSQKKKKFSVDFQSIKNTNAILAQNNINYQNIDTYTIKQLSEILGVDGIISGNLELNILLSEGAESDFSLLDYILGHADYGWIGIKISDGKTGKLLWKYEKEITKKSGKNTDDLIDKMMKAAARKFPYDKEKSKG